MTNGRACGWLPDLLLSNVCSTDSNHLLAVTKLQNLKNRALVRAALFSSGLLLIPACAIPRAQPKVSSSQAEADQRFVPQGRDYWGELDIHGRVDEISVAPTGRVWITTATGGNYSAARIDGDWREGGIGGQYSESHGRSVRFGPGMQRIDFFNDTIGFAWGHTSDHKRKIVQVIRTRNGGESWEQVEVGPGSMINAAFAAPGGNAWLGVTAPDWQGPGRIFHSADFGTTWTQLEPLPPIKSPISIIFMENSSEGFLGELNNGIYRTSDGGRTWDRIPTPQQQGAYGKDWRRDSFARVHELVPFGDWLLINQDGRVFATRRDPVHWKSIANINLYHFVLDRSTDRLFAVDDSLRIVELDRELGARRISNAVLAAPPRSLSAMSGRVYAMDLEGRLYTIDHSGSTSTFPLTSDGPTRPMTQVRMGEGDLWGSTGRGIYSSADTASTWFRIPYDAATVRGLRVRNAEEAFVWDGRGVNTIVNRRTGTTNVVADLIERDVIDVVEHGGRWYAYGGLQHESARRIEVARTFFSGEFRGSQDHGFVYVSSDQGKTWALIDRWPEGGVMKLFIHPSGHLTLQSYTGSLRQVRRTGNGYQAENLLLAGAENREKVPYVEHGFSLYFADDTTGYIGGWIHHVGDRYFRTRDGGRSWEAVEENDFPYKSPMPWGEGYFAHTASKVYFLHGHKVTEVADVAPHFEEARAWIQAVSRAGERKVLVQLGSGTLLLLDTDRRTWEPLHAPILEPSSSGTAKTPGD